MRALAAELARRHAGLFAAGALNLLAALVVLGLMPFDELSVTGAPRWLKPFKFGVSVALYLWSLAWLLPTTTRARAAARGIGSAVAVTLVLENACIFVQAARGTSSHYNTSSAFDGIVFGLMGVLIAINSALVLGLLVMSFARPAEAPRAWTWGLRAGLALFLVGSAQGVGMITAGAHTVGAPDGGPGLPLLDWSTSAGDLRAAHMLALHGLQLLPLAGHLLGRVRAWSPGSQARVLLLIALAYAAAVALLQWQAAQGHPLLNP